MTIEEPEISGLAADVMEVVKAARAFWDTTDLEPLRGLSHTQGLFWDDLCEALANLDKGD